MFVFIQILCSGEGDGLSGLIVDVYSDAAVVQSGAFWVEKYRQLIESCVKSDDNSMIKNVYWQRLDKRLALEGWEKPTNDIAPPPQIDNDVVSNSKVDIVESGVKYSCSPHLGQKTGFYCDQRENRAFVRSIAKGKDVLDLYSYCGGFGLNAALGGARSVVCVDSSERAIAWAQDNARANGIVGVVEDRTGTGTGNDIMKFVCDDCVSFMREAVSKKQQYDIVVCDPPKLAPSQSSVILASKKYTQINQLALSLVKPEGILITCTCSAAMVQDGAAAFRQVLQVAANKSGRRIKILHKKSAGPDHPVDINCPESEYLAVFVLQVL